MTRCGCVCEHGLVSLARLCVGVIAGLSGLWCRATVSVARDGFQRKQSHTDRPCEIPIRGSITKKLSLRRQSKQCISHSRIGNIVMQITFIRAYKLQLHTPHPHSNSASAYSHSPSSPPHPPTATNSSPSSSAYRSSGRSYHKTCSRRRQRYSSCCP